MKKMTKYIIYVIIILAIAIGFVLYYNSTYLAKDVVRTETGLIQKDQPCNFDKQCLSGICGREKIEIDLGSKTQASWADAKLLCGQKTDGEGQLTFTTEKWICFTYVNLCL